MNKPDDKQKFAEIIRQLIPINELPHEVQNEIINNAELVTVKRKQLVFSQGDRDNYSYYLLEGEVELEANKQIHNAIAAGTDRARYPMAQLQPRQFSGKAKTDAVVLRLNRNSLDKLLVMHQNTADAVSIGDISGSFEVGVVAVEEEDGVDWMTRMLQSEIFSGMPTSNIHQLFALLEPVEYKAGDTVIRQGEPGHHYYIIQEGRCEVLRQAGAGGKDIKLAELGPGDGFGEEALITETTRNATIRMLTAGVIAQLSQDDFARLIQNPTLKSVSAQRAAGIVQSGGNWLDVRFKNEYDRSTIAGCMHVPLNLLRSQIDKLSRDVHYVLFCDTGGRSSTGAFLLTDRGYTASYLEGGLVNNIELAPPEDVTNAPKMPPQIEPKPAAAAAAPAGRPAPAKSPAAPAESAEEEIDPEIMSSMLDAELSHTNLRLARAKKQDQTQQNNQALAKKLEAERARIEEQKKRVETEVQKLRKTEAARLKRLEQESEKRMQVERKKIEEVYNRNAREMEKLEKMKQEAQEKLRLERERIEREAESARQNKQDAEKIRVELEAARKAMDEEGKKRELEQETLRKQIEMAARKTIEEERRKLAEHFSRNNQEIAQARREKAIAEAARQAAKKEAELMIEEYKAQHDRSREEVEQRIREERLKLEAEQKKIHAVLLEVQKTKAEAEALKRSALAEVSALKARQFQKEILANEKAKNELKDKIKDAQEKLVQASESAARAEQDEEKVVVAKKVNDADLQKKKAEEEALAKQLQADLADFKEELEEQEREAASATTQLEHMRRIKERALAAKHAAENAAHDLLTDVAKQLGKKE